MLVAVAVVGHLTCTSIGPHFGQDRLIMYGTFLSTSTGGRSKGDADFARAIFAGEAGVASRRIASKWSVGPSISPPSLPLHVQVHVPLLGVASTS